MTSISRLGYGFHDKAFNLLTRVQLLSMSLSSILQISSQGAKRVQKSAEKRKKGAEISKENGARRYTKGRKRGVSQKPATGRSFICS